MPTALVSSEGQGGTEELEKIVSSLKHWEIHRYDEVERSVQSLDMLLNQVDLHFLIYDKQLSKDSIQELDGIRKRMPFTSIVYYHSVLLNQQYLILAQFEVNACIIGKYRQRYLLELLPRLWDKHWKKIPAWIYSTDTSSLNPWASSVISFIENHTLNLCNLHDLSNHFNISKSHFRAEFRENLGINFREFKQNLFIHYETKLLVEKKYKPIDVYKLLNYSNLANFSRSFKSRHGESWRNFNSGDTDISH